MFDFDYDNDREMCTLILLRRPGQDWPLLVAANRDELASRPCLPPGRHWPEWPEVVGGLDQTGGGSWLGVNDHGLLAAVLNRDGTLGPAAGKRSRGELVLEALDHAEANLAAGALADLSPDAYRPFNLVIADPRDAWWLRHGGDGEIRVHRIPDGLHLLAGTELDDPHHPRLRAALPRVRAAATPTPDPTRPAAAQDEDWADWIAVLAGRGFDPADGPHAAMTLAVPTPDGLFATRSASLIALPRYPGSQPRVWLHAEGPPDQARFLPVAD